MHFQLTDRAQPAFAAGLPFRFTDTDAPDGLPKNEQPFVASGAAASH